MALYGYFRSKDELLEAVVGRLLEEIPPAPPGLGWRDILRRLAYGLRSVAGRYPAVLPVLLTRPAVSPGALRVVDVVYQALLDAGVPPGRVARLERMFSTFAIGHILSEVSGRLAWGRSIRAPAARSCHPRCFPATTPSATTSTSPLTGTTNSRLTCAICATWQPPWPPLTPTTRQPDVSFGSTFRSGL
jgi:AcrR family transcriptional regulator